MILEEEDYLEHYGILRRSGRYPWNSGGNENNAQSQVNSDFLRYFADMKAQGMTDVEICRGVGMSTTEYRAAKTIAKAAQKQAHINAAVALKDKGVSNVAGAKQMGIPESTFRSLIKESQQEKVDILQTTATMLRGQVADKKYLDVGTGVENHIGVSKEKLGAAVALLKEEGYEVHSLKVAQLGTGNETRLKILVAPGTTYGELSRNRSEIKQVTDFSEDGGRTFLGIHTPMVVNPKRVGINYAEDGGTEADGVIYVRPGVKDVSLGQASYAQVRIAVGDGHYLKGMAMYRDDLPDGVDLVFNTNKSDTGNKLNALKKVTGDPDNPFGAQISKQIVVKGADGKETLTSAMNIINEEGNWTDWSRNLSSQMLSKQSPTLAREQLGKTYDSRLKEFETINALTNPTVKKKLLEAFADETDSASVHLKAAAMPKQASHVILPIKTMKPTEVYAPNYLTGERVVLVRYPHGGTFEIPDLVVNNNHPEAKRLLGQAKDAIGIHSSVAERLSGADFDGDTVLVIPNGSNKVKVTPALEQLKGFDPRRQYKAYEGMVPISAKEMQQQMGKVSNLITDMTIRKAPASEIARAVRHSMVVIDAEKHNLNYKQSAIDNGISSLKEKYQGGPTSGATTLISRASSTVYLPQRKDRPMAKGGPVDKETGKRVYEETGKTYVNSKGVEVPSLTKSKRLAETDDAHTLSSKTPVERVYADHSNKLKTLANRARLEAVNTPRSKYSPTANKAYPEEVASLESKLFLAVRNRPLERQAQILANATAKAKRDASPDMDRTQRKRIESQALNEARNRTGADQRERITITPKEWDAIQAGAISDHKLSQILTDADIDVVRTLATPRPKKLMSTAKIARAQSLFKSGATRAEVASALGVSLTTLDEVTDVDG